jgi:hypothetical protein
VALSPYSKLNFSIRHSQELCFFLCLKLHPPLKVLKHKRTKLHVHHE